MPSRVARPWLEPLTRAGLVGYGAVHLLFAWVIVRIAFGRPPADGDQSGALHTLAAKPFGAVLIGLIVVGLVAMTVWQAFEAAIGHRAERGRHRVYERLASAGRAAFYAYAAKGAAYAIAGILLVLAAIQYDPDKARGLDAALRTMAAQPYGTWLLTLTALGIAAYGLFSVVQSRYRKV